MNILEKLIKLHKPVGVYDIKEGGNIYRELSVYADALDELLQELETVQREGFILSAEDEGLSQIEQVFGGVRYDLAPTQRRSMIKARCSLSSGDFTPSVLSKFMDVLGIQAQVWEYPSVFRLTFRVEGEHPLSRRKWIASQLKALLPAHLEVDPVFEGFSFADIKKNNLTFGEMEKKAMNWADIDIYCKT